MVSVQREWSLCLSGSSVEGEVAAWPALPSWPLELHTVHFWCRKRKYRKGGLLHRLDLHQEEKERLYYDSERQPRKKLSCFRLREEVGFLNYH